MSELPAQFFTAGSFFSQAWHLRPHEDVPLAVAVEAAEIVDQACVWFTNPRAMFVGDASAPRFPDEVVDAVCAAMQGQLDKEGKSRTMGATCSRHGVPHTTWYKLMELPAPWRRSLVERLWALKQRDGLKVRVFLDDGTPAPAAPAPGYSWPGAGGGAANDFGYMMHDPEVLWT